MSTIRSTCPHCLRVERLGLGQQIDRWPVYARRPWLDGVERARIQYVDFEAVIPLQCHLCGGWSFGLFASSDKGLDIIHQSIGSAQGIEKYGDIMLLHLYPDAEKPTAPKSVPERARVFFIEAKEDLLAGRDSAGVISKCRSVLDLCLKELNAAGSGRKARISDLEAKGILTKTLAEWAGTLWDDGNEAVHDLVGDSTKARQHVEFLELFFEVAFALPEQIARARETPEPPDGAE